MLRNIKKRDGRVAEYDIQKIAGAIDKAMAACNRHNPEESMRIAKLVEQNIEKNFAGELPSVEDIQDAVETELMNNGYAFVAKKYIIYRSERTHAREMNMRLTKVFDELTFADSRDSDMKRDNANIDGDTAMGTMLKYGSESAKDYYIRSILTTEQSKAHLDGDIHIHDLDFYTLTTTCCQIDLIKLFEGGFSTGHGYLREPNNIASYSALACIAIQSNQNDQHGGQSIVNFDYGLAKGVIKTFQKRFLKNMRKGFELLLPEAKVDGDVLAKITAQIQEEHEMIPCLDMGEEYFEIQEELLRQYTEDAETVRRIQEFARKSAIEDTDNLTYQAMEALIHNLNTMHSRAGAQTPFSSINYGMDTTSEGRMIVKNVLLATEAGLGMGETPIFPIQIFRVKEGVNYNPGDPNYDLLRLAYRVSAKRLFPNFSFIDAPFNKAYYKEGRPETEIAYMGCRTRVIGNVYDKSNQISYGRGNLSFTSINLPRIAIKSNGNLDYFFEELERKMDLVSKQLLDRYHIISHKKVKNFPFLMGQGVWINSNELGPNDEIGEILKHGTLSIGFIGLAETLVALRGQHHGESQQMRTLGLEIVSFMRDYMDRLSEEKGLNFTLLATPAEGLSGRFVRMDRERYGVIKGVTDKEYYTNSFHVPVGYDISAYEKIRIEAPYHGLTNAGHITYVELDGDTAQNVEAFEAIIRCMHDAGIGYGSVNHPVDRDPCCGYSGVIGDQCPKCGRKETDGETKFERIRRITGYLVGTVDRFNDAKKAEERDRVKHGLD